MGTFHLYSYQSLLIPFFSLLMSPGMSVCVCVCVCVYVCVYNDPKDLQHHVHRFDIKI